MSSCLIAVAALVTVGLPGSEPSAPRNDSIRQQDMKADLFFLAGDGFRGRLTATPENGLASQFIASRFQRMVSGELDSSLHFLGRETGVKENQEADNLADRSAALVAEDDTRVSHTLVIQDEIIFVVRINDSLVGESKCDMVNIVRTC